MTLYHDKWLFLAIFLALVPLIWWHWLSKRRRTAVRFSSFSHLRRCGTTWAVKARIIVPILRTLAVALLVFCIARPQKGDEQTRIVSEGIAIQLLVDRSGSMLAEDFNIDNKRANRLAVVKSVARDFVLGDKESDLGGRPDDLVGMITFAGYADSKCPMTLDHAYLAETLEQVECADEQKYPGEDGTAIGDAIALGVERMRDLQQRRDALEANRIKSKILVLLTDGEQTRGDLTPQQGAELAKALGVKIYTIGVGTKGMAPMPYFNPFLQQVQMRAQPVKIDEATLKEIAEMTGGEYFRATDTESLRHVYARIDELEKTKTEEKRYLQHVEMATEATTLGNITYPPLLLVVLGLLTVEILLVNTRFRRVP